MNSPTPAIVAQTAVRRLPRPALWLLCVAYVLPGFVGREPWKAQDMTAFGYMFELARGAADWFHPTLLSRPPEFDALLPYWLGAWAIRWAPPGVVPDVAARVPFIALLALTLSSTWWAIYHLARRRQAQPVAFAFGGEAHPVDYARALADAGLLALIACLGLAQFSHETTPSLAQLGFASLAFYGLAALPERLAWPAAALALGLTGLGLSGAPSMAVLFALGGCLAVALESPSEDAPSAARRRIAIALALALAVLVAALASGLSMWRWRLATPHRDWAGEARTLVWFTWPTWPLALWTLWRWRRQMDARHVALPLWFVLITVLSALASEPSERALLLGLPAFAAMAAFALPTLSRTVSAVIDWFTLLFFTGWVLVIWGVWISLQTGVPPKPAQNVYRLAPGYEPSFSLLAFVVALLGTVAWAALVRWRAGRHQAAIWKTLVLPAGGATLCWLLIMTLWLPVLDYARSYVPTVRGVLRTVGPRPGCVEVAGLDRPQVAALLYHGALTLREARAEPVCRWRVVEADMPAWQLQALNPQRWRLAATVRRPTDKRDTLRIYRRVR